MSFGKGKSVLLAVLFMYLLGLVQVLPAYAETRLPPPAANSASEAPVVVIPVHQTIESGLQKFMERSVRSAEQARASYIILDINTLGGRVDSAEGIGELIRSSSVPTIAYIHGKAVSAGSYIALNASAIIMEPGSSIGAAAVVDITGNEIESAKVISHWSSQMRSAAELRGRKPLIAEGMVDKNLVVAMPEIGRTAEKGQIVSLTADEALKVGYAERSAKDMKEVLAFLGAENRPVITEEPSPAEKFARILTDPFIATLLLIVGIAGIAIELFVPGFGLPGIIGLLGFVLYFFGHYIVGFAGVEDIVLFVIGVLLLIIEIFVSSFGILGVAGILCLFGSVIMAAYNTKQALLSLTWASVIAIVIIVVVVRIFKHRGVWNRFILRDSLTAEEGYVPTVAKSYLTGQTGVALTPLRPAGSAVIAGEKLDVVTEGTFIPAKSQIEVLRVEGSRIVVGMKE
jgi:membrane-bound serine protease (ClpP class)